MIWTSAVGSAFHHFHHHFYDVELFIYCTFPVINCLPQLTELFSPDFRGGFELHSAEEVEKESHLLEELERLSLSGPRGSRERPHTSKSFTPLLDIPVDRYDTESRDLRPPSAGPMLPNWLLAHSSDSRPPLRTDIGTIRSVHFDEVSLHSSSDKADTERGRSPFRNHQPKGKKEQSGEKSKESVFTLQSAARRRRPSVSQVFDRQVGNEQVSEQVSEQVNGHRSSAENGLRTSDPEEQYELNTVSISKTKQSLGKFSLNLRPGTAAVQRLNTLLTNAPVALLAAGISISGGMESKIQPMVKIEKIFPGGAASTCEVLKVTNWWIKIRL